MLRAKAGDRTDRRGRGLGCARAAGTALLLASLAGCAVGPDYVRPRVAVPAAYKEAGAWKIAEPGDEIAHGAWWRVFDDPHLDVLASRVEISNQNLAVAEAQYRAARVAVGIARAGYFPTIGAGASVIVGRRGASSSSGTGTTAGGAPQGVSTDTAATFSLPLQLSWEADVWGRIRRTVEANEAMAQASAADLESARLSALAALARDYFQLRALDAERETLDAAVTAYANILRVTNNRYRVGVISQADVLQAEAQLEATRAQAVDLGVERALLEHAIAVLVGEPASSFSIPEAPLAALPPSVPVHLPSELLERRPDIAAAERRVAAQNARIGVAEAAYFPRITLSASAGLESTSLSRLFGLPSFFWSLGPTVAETLFDGGARGAQTEQARAAYDAAAASYRQVVLVAFQEVENALATLRILKQEAQIQARALDAARRSLAITTNQYEVGNVSYLEQLVAETTALRAERTTVELLGRRMVATVLLIQALGGGWSAAEL